MLDALSLRVIAYPDWLEIRGVIPTYVTGILYASGLFLSRPAAAIGCLGGAAMGSTQGANVPRRHRLALVLGRE